jgi:hypothetical protein
VDLVDLFWNVSQERQLEELRRSHDRLRREHDLANGGSPQVKDLAEENLELKVRLLISKGVITAQEYAALIAETCLKSDGAAPN